MLGIYMSNYTMIVNSLLNFHTFSWPFHSVGLARQWMWIIYSKHNKTRWGYFLKLLISVMKIFPLVLSRNFSRAFWSTYTSFIWLYYIAFLRKSWVSLMRTFAGKSALPQHSFIPGFVVWHGMSSWWLLCR